MTETNVDALRNALATANADLEEAVRRLAPKRVGGEMEAYEAALQKLLLAERQLASAENHPYAVPQECALRWDVGAPLPTLLQSDNRTYLFFLLADEDDGVGIIEFELCWSTSFGSPGDETFEGHPLHGRGFEPYTAMRVINSPWVENLRKIDSVHERHDPSDYSRASHFIFPFHDTTFECVARSFRTSRASGPLSHIVMEAVSRLF